MVLRQGFAVALLAGCLVGSSACATGPELDLTLHESDRGKVYLERIPERALQAAHPITLSADTMVRILRGVVVKEDREFLGLLGFFDKPKVVRAFTDEEAEYLAPLLVEGLTRAASDQQVGFRIAQNRAPAESTKQGSLYAYGRSLYLTLPWLVPMSRYGAGGPAPSHTIFFIPESAKRPDSYHDRRSNDTTLAIDYELLARLPPAADPVTTAVQTPPTAVQPSAKQGSAPKDPELEALRKELEDIKRQLADQKAQRNLTQPKLPVSPKSP